MKELYNESCLEVFKRLEDNSVDLIVTDPPYKTTAKGCTGSTGGMFLDNKVKKGQMFNHNSINIKDYAGELYRVLKDGSHCYVMTNHINLVEMLNELQSAGFHFIKCLIWNKGNKIMGRFYMSQFEYIIFLRKGKGVQINNCGTSDILNIPNKKQKFINEKGKKQNLHDTEKPVELMEILIENSSKVGDLVLDPFMGIGATVVAAKKLHREYIGIELDKNYYDIACDRLKDKKEVQTSIFDM